MTIVPVFERIGLKGQNKGNFYIFPNIHGEIKSSDHTSRGTSWIKSHFKGYLVDHGMTSKTSCTSQSYAQIKAKNKANYE